MPRDLFRYGATKSHEGISRAHPGLGETIRLMTGSANAPPRFDHPALGEKSRNDATRRHRRRYWSARLHRSSLANALDLRGVGVVVDRACHPQISPTGLGRRSRHRPARHYPALLPHAWRERYTISSNCLLRPTGTGPHGPAHHQIRVPGDLMACAQLPPRWPQARRESGAGPRAVKRAPQPGDRATAHPAWCFQGQQAGLAEVKSSALSRRPHRPTRPGSSDPSASPSIGCSGSNQHQAPPPSYS